MELLIDTMIIDEKGSSSAHGENVDTRDKLYSLVMENGNG